MACWPRPCGRPCREGSVLGSRGKDLSGGPWMSDGAEELERAGVWHHLASGGMG